MATAPGALWGGGGKAGDNQFMTGPGVGVVPSSPGGGFGPGTYGPGQPNSWGVVNSNSQTRKSGYSTVQPLFPQFTSDFYNWLQGQIGQGVQPFNLQTVLPSSGAATAPGQLNAPLTNVLEQLQSFYSGGPSTVPGSDTLRQLATTGMPTDVGAAWQAMIDAQQRNIAQQGANLREQFAFGGDLASSPFGQAATDFYSQTAKDQNALLAQMQQQASEAAAGRAMQTGMGLTNNATQLGGALQGLDQQAIQNMLQEFMRTQPQYNPLINMLFSGATTFPPTVQTGSGSGGLGGVLGDLGGLLSMIPGIGPAIGAVSKGLGGIFKGQAATAPGPTNQGSTGFF